MLRLLTVSMAVWSSLAFCAAGGTTFRDLLAAGPGEEINYATRHGTKLSLFAFKPAGEPPPGGWPAIMLIHGGGWIGGTPDAFMHLGRYFASRGVAAFNITYRLAKPGVTTVADCVTDCRSALRFVRANAVRFQIDPRRIAVLGDSAGGHLAAALSTLETAGTPGEEDIRGTPDAVLLFNPIVDMTDGDWIRFAVGGEALADRAKTPRPSSEEALALARSLSPVFHIRPGQAPALVMHATGDKVVSVAQARAFEAASRAAGNRCDLVLLGDDVGHAFVIPGYKWPEPVVVDAVRRADKFLSSLGWIPGEPTLEDSGETAWQSLKK